MAMPAQAAPEDARMSLADAPEESKVSATPREQAVAKLEATLVKREAEDRANAEPERPINVAMQDNANLAERNHRLTQELIRKTNFRGSL